MVDTLNKDNPTHPTDKRIVLYNIHEVAINSRLELQLYILFSLFLSSLHIRCYLRYMIKARDY